MTAYENAQILQAITTRTEALALRMGIADQLAGMNAGEKLIEMSMRFSLLKVAGAKQAIKNCLDLAAVFEKVTNNS